MNDAGKLHFAVDVESYRGASEAITRFDALAALTLTEAYIDGSVYFETRKASIRIHL